jgi:uncharacterized protein (TIGR02246 family)
MLDLLIAESAVRQLHARYIDALWRKDTAAFVGCFTVDAQWKVAGLQASGRVQIGNQFEKLMAPSERVVMFVGMPLIDIEHDKASSRVHVTEYVKRRDGSAMRTIGIYYDRYLCEDGCWLFQQRHFDLCYRGAPDFSAAFCEVPDYGPPPGMPDAD